jgi:hypothetical protein
MKTLYNIESYLAGEEIKSCENLQVITMSTKPATRRCPEPIEPFFNKPSSFQLPTTDKTDTSRHANL